MKLIEKKCPNCGASLEFSETAKSCKCDYCHRTFEIERDNNGINIDFNLNELEKPFMMMAKGVFIIPIIGILIIATFVIIGIVAMDMGDNKNNDFDTEEKEEEKLLTSVKDMSSTEIEHLDSSTKFDIAINGEGESSTKHSYSRDEEPKREKLYVAYKKGSNKVIFIYKVVYKDFFHQDDVHTVYIPMIYENVNKAVSNAGDVKMDAPTYYFNSDHTCYYYGYGSFEEAYNNIIAPLKDEYKISEK